MRRRRNFNWTLPPEIESRLGETSYGRQRAFSGGGHLLIVLHAPPTPESREREAVVFLRRPDGRWQANGVEGGEQRMRRLLSEYRSRLDELDQNYETATTADGLFRLLEALTPLTRAARNLADALQSARELESEDRFLISMRDDGADLAREFEVLSTDARLKLDYRMAKNAEMGELQAARMALAQHKLNVIAAITLPVSAMAALLGMNLVHGMEGRSPVWFAIVAVVGLALGLGVKMWVGK